MQFVDIPEGFQSASVVPDNCISQILESIAAVEHLPNKHAATSGEHKFSSHNVVDLLY